MKFAIYNENTKELVAVESGSLDPLESEKQGKPIYLVPANSTEIIPEDKSGYVNVWNGTSWDLLEDNRGIKYWLPGDTYVDEAHVMTELGKLPRGAVLSRPSKSIEIRSEEKRAERDRLLVDTDKYMLNDYPVNDEVRNQYVGYRKYLRDLPQDKKFPDIEILSFDDWVNKQ